MYIPDFDSCRYYGGHFDPDNWSVPLLYIGYLEYPHLFPCGEVSAAIVPKLIKHQGQFRSRFSRYGFKGIYSCSFCDEMLGMLHTRILFQLDLVFPGDGVVYVAPGGIIHYIEHHGYTPPAEFLAAILRCPVADSPEYLAALRQANAGNIPPLEPTKDEDDDDDGDDDGTSRKL